MYNEITLLNKTGHQKVDDVLRGGIGICEMVFENRIRGYYLVGSYADGTAVSTSDIDMKVVFKDRFQDEGERLKAGDLCFACFTRVSPYRSDVMPTDEQTVFRSDWSRVQLKGNSVLVYGEDIRDQITLPEVDNHIWRSMHRASSTCFSQILRPDVKPKMFPLDYPDGSDDFYGYIFQNRTKNIHYIVCAFAAAIVASQVRTYVFTKSDCLSLYKQHINDEWTSLMNEVCEICRERWEYTIPDDKEYRSFLKDLCCRMLAFENYFGTVHRDYLINELKHGDENRVTRAVKRFGEIIYKDDEVIAALEACKQHGNSELRTAVSETIKTIQQSV